MYGVGAIVGPFLASAAMTLVSNGVLYLYTAIVHLAILIFVLLRLFSREPAPMDQHVPFSEALTAVQTASQVFEEEYEDQQERSAQLPATAD
jgi:hypothetical protein